MYLAPFQPASSGRGWAIDFIWLELPWHYIAMTRNNLCKYYFSFLSLRLTQDSNLRVWELIKAQVWTYGSFPYCKRHIFFVNNTNSNKNPNEYNRKERDNRIKSEVIYIFSSLLHESRDLSQTVNKSTAVISQRGLNRWRKYWIFKSPLKA